MISYTIWKNICYTNFIVECSQGSPDACYPSLGGFTGPGLHPEQHDVPKNYQSYHFEEHLLNKFHCRMLPRLSRCFLPQSGGLYRPWTPPRTTWWSGIWGKWSISLLWPTSCLWKNVLKCNPGPAEASKLSLDGPCDPLTGPGQDHDEPDVLELGSNFIFFMLSNFC